MSDSSKNVFCMNMARSYVGKNVNLYFKDGSVLVNVLVNGKSRNTPLRGGPSLDVVSRGVYEHVPLRKVAYVKVIDFQLRMIDNSAGGPF
jgi:hypothetical protein